jgi:hypothetical protein
MNKQLISAVMITILLVAVSASAAATSASFSVDVKKGDWIEYQVKATGNFPEEHNAQWARMEIVDVQGDIIHLNVTTLLIDGTYVFANVTVNFDTGDLEEGFFVPSNVAVGDVFVDNLVGNITVSGVEQKTYAGAERTVLLGVSPESTFVWDKAKGMLVEAHSFYPEFNFTYDTVADKTNMWKPQILGLDPIRFYALSVATVVTVFAVIVAILVWHQRKSP